MSMSRAKITCKSSECVNTRVHKDLIKLIGQEKKRIQNTLNKRSKYNKFDVTNTYASKMLAARLLK